MRLSRPPPTKLKLAKLLSDPDTHAQLIASLLVNLHRRRCCHSILAKRIDDQPHRILVTLTRFQSMRMGAHRVWCVVTWNIDALSMHFQGFATKQEAVLAYQATRNPTA